MSFQFSQITCSHESNYQYMKEYLTFFCKPGFTVENVTSTRCKKLLGGKCCWTCHYRLIYGNINTKSSFKEAVNQLSANKPHQSKVVAYGRYGSSDYGLFITFGNTLCHCVMDFRYHSTPFPILEPRIREAHATILFINRSNIAEMSNLPDSEEDENDINLDEIIECSLVHVKTDSFVTFVTVPEGVVVAIERSEKFGIIEPAIERNWLVYCQQNLEKCTTPDIESIFEKFNFMALVVAENNQIRCKHSSSFIEKSEMKEYSSIEAAVNFIQQSSSSSEADIIIMAAGKVYNQKVHNTLCPRFHSTTKTL